MLSRLPREDLTADTAEEVVVELEAEQRAALLAQAMETLGKADQQVIALCDLAEVSYADAAVALAVPIGTVRSRLARARGKVHRALKALPGDESLEHAFPTARPQGGVR